MKKYLPIIKSSPLFINIEEQNIIHFLHCSHYKIKHYKKNEYIINNEDYMNSVYIILDGRALYLLEEPDGTRNLIGVIYAPHLFAFGLNYYNKPSTNISVISDDASTILSLNFNTTIEACENRCPFHKTIVNNLIGDLCHKNISCIEKMQHMGRSSIRAKVMSYLQAESKKRNSNDFYIPYNRQQLAEYFGIDRSALSKELSNMKTEGLIDYYKNYFVLLHPHNIS